MLCIHPRQVEIVNGLYTPSSEMLDHARRIVDAFEDAATKGQGALLLDGKMIDPPVVERALSLLRRNPGHKARA